VPTTLLAQVDSSIGGKTGVDLPEGKNLLGAFHQPRMVWIDPHYLKTLPALQFRQGMAEVIKTALLGDESLWSYLEEHSEAVRAGGDDALVRVISSCCKVKASVVEADERESGRRRILNLGHTVGHALERLSDYELPHGDAVSIGMVVAARLAVRLGQFSEADAQRLERLCATWELPVRLPGEFPPELIIESLKSDKKRMEQKLHFILPMWIGGVTEVVSPDERVLMAVMEELIS
jgi:3-dehydroquinate synthase